MDVKSAIFLAWNYTNDFFCAENIANLKLEEVEFDDNLNQ